MALSTTTAISRIRALVAEVTGMQRVYAPSETDANGVPPAFNETPCALVIPGPTLEYILSAGQERHTYEVKIQVFESGGDSVSRTASALPFVDLIIAKFGVNVTLGNRVNSCILRRNSGFVSLEYGGITYAGYELALEVSEQGLVTAATGS